MNIIEEVQKVKAEDIKFEGNRELIEIIGEEMDKKFLAKVKTVSISPDVVARHKDLKIVYTPIHGTGVKLIPAALRAFGFNNIFNVPLSETTRASSLSSTETRLPCCSSIISWQKWRRTVSWKAMNSL